MLAPPRARASILQVAPAAAPLRQPVAEALEQAEVPRGAKPAAPPKSPKPANAPKPASASPKLAPDLGVLISGCQPHECSSDIRVMSGTGQRVVKDAYGALTKAVETVLAAHFAKHTTEVGGGDKVAKLITNR